MNKEIEIPFGAKDSELKGWEYTIPEGMEAEIKDGKIIVREKEGDDERIRKDLITFICQFAPERLKVQYVAYLERQKEQKPAEWGEKDEALLKEIVSFFKDGTTKLQHDLDLYAGFLEKKFKSLRPQPHWKPSEEDEERLINTSISFLKDFADKGYENAVECIDWLKSKLNGNSGK